MLLQRARVTADDERQEFIHILSYVRVRGKKKWWFILPACDGAALCGQMSSLARRPRAGHDASIIPKLVQQLLQQLMLRRARFANAMSQCESTMERQKYVQSAATDGASFFWPAFVCSAASSSSTTWAQSKLNCNRPRTERALMGVEAQRGRGPVPGDSCKIPFQP